MTLYLVIAFFMWLGAAITAGFYFYDIHISIAENLLFFRFICLQQYVKLTHFFFFLGFPYE